MCSRNHRHEALQGNAFKGEGKTVTRTSLAAEYSSEFSVAYGRLVVSDPSFASCSAAAVADHVSQARASTLLAGTPERDLSELLSLQRRRTTRQGLASESRTSSFVATPCTLHL